MGELTRNFILDVAMGKIPGYRQQLLLGQRFDQNIIEGSKTIWDHTDSIQFLTVETALFASSSSAADTSTQIVVCGLDGNYEEKFTVTPLTGQTQVAVGSFLIVHSAVTAIAAAVGDIYIAETDTLTAGVPDTSSKIQSKVIAGQGITHNGFITVPSGHAAINMVLRGTTDGVNKSSQIANVIHPPTGPEFIGTTFSVSEAFPGFIFPAPIATTTVAGAYSPIFPEKTTIEFRAEVNTNSTDTFFGVDWLFIQQEEFLR